jgi:acetyltransferase-like isoleucine patch superfamily enzyme
MTDRSSVVPRIKFLLRRVLCKFGYGIKVGPNSHISKRAILDASVGGSITIGSKCTIHDYAMLMTYGGNITIGNYSTVNPFCVLYGHGGLSIGDGVRIATHTVVIPANHNFEDTDRYIYLQGLTCLGITIKDDVWIGAGARILDGVTIGKGAVVASGAVVARDVPDYAIVAGVPARVIRYRGRSSTAATTETVL